MHDIKAIRDNPQAFDKGLARRGLPPCAELLIALDEKRRAAIAELQRAQERRNAASKEIGAAMARKDAAAADELKAEVAGLKATMPELEAAERELTQALDDALAAIPNLPFDDVPDGKDENDNVEVRRYGDRPRLPQRLHAEGAFRDRRGAGPDGLRRRRQALGRALRRAEGRRWRGSSRALEQFMLDLHTTEHGYTEIEPPVLVRDDAMFGTAQLPKFDEDQFKLRARLR